MQRVFLRGRTRLHRLQALSWRTGSTSNHCWSAQTRNQLSRRDTLAPTGRLQARPDEECSEKEDSAKASQKKNVKVETIDSCPREKPPSFPLEYILSGIFCILAGRLAKTELFGNASHLNTPRDRTEEQDSISGGEWLEDQSIVEGSRRNRRMMILLLLK